jgi:hypothetical protein
LNAYNRDPREQAASHASRGALGRIGLAHTQFAEATCRTIRLNLLKIGALATISVRRIRFAMTSA